MAETVTEKQACSKCGAEVREGTAFCYACGGRVAADPSPDTPAQANGSTPAHDAETQAALSDLADKLKGDKPTAEPENKLAKAAEERKKARVTLRKGREFVWEPRSDFPITLLIAVVLIIVAVAFVVVVTVVWK